MERKERQPRIERVMIVAKRQKPEALAVARQLARLVERLGRVAIFDPETSRLLRVRRARGSRSAPPDLYVVVGGDGTLLSVARAIPGPSRPILGVNLGGLGFLTETGPEEAAAVLGEVLEGRYVLERRMRLSVALVRSGRTVLRQQVLNDVVINKSALARMLELRLAIDRTVVTTYRADGLIASTPTGSTAYSLSAGGPIIHPDMEALLIAPICPHTLTMRPLVVPADSRVEMSLRTGDSEVYMTLDGQVGHPLKVGDRVRVARSGTPALMVRLRRRNYFEVLRHKLRWGER
jgi:NAD+ kinase